jgi:hypothetical protein
MVDRLKFCISIAASVALFASAANAEARKEIKTEKGKPVVIGNFLNAPPGCGSNPGPVPLPRLREKPSHGLVLMQIVVADVPATDGCPARKVPAIALFYTPSQGFVGTDSVQIEFDTGDNKTTAQSLQITVQEAKQ